MSKQYNIRWRDSDERELKRVVRNFNAKIDRLAKKDPQNANALPEKVRVGQLKELIDTRQDLKRELKSLQRFSKRGSEELVTIPDSQYNIKITQWQKQEMSIRAGLVTRKRKKRKNELEEIEVTSRGEKLGYTAGQFGMGRADEIALRPIKAFYRTMNRVDVNKRFKSLVKQSQSTYFNRADEQYRQNYIKSLIENYNSEDIEDVIKKIEDMNINDFISQVKAEDPNFEFNYPPDEDEYEQYVNQIRAIWIPNRRKR